MTYVSKFDSIVLYLIVDIPRRSCWVQLTAKKIRLPRTEFVLKVCFFLRYATTSANVRDGAPAGGHSLLSNKVKPPGKAFTVCRLLGTSRAACKKAEDAVPLRSWLVPRARKTLRAVVAFLFCFSHLLKKKKERKCKCSKSPWKIT